jgi:hypothetical protein
MNEVVFEDHLDERSRAEVHEDIFDLLIDILLHEVCDGLTFMKRLPIQSEEELSEGKREERDLNKSILMNISRDWFWEYDPRIVSKVATEFHQMFGL